MFTLEVVAMRRKWTKMLREMADRKTIGKLARIENTYDHAEWRFCALGVGGLAVGLSNETLLDRTVLWNSTQLVLGLSCDEHNRVITWNDGKDGTAESRMSFPEIADRLDAVTDLNDPTPAIESIIQPQESVHANPKTDRTAQPSDLCTEDDDVASGLRTLVASR